jgi:hypothetical protein
MNKAEEWVSDLEENLYNGEKCPYPWRDNLKLAFKEGMLASADIAELAKEYILPADDLADVIATQIRNYANEPGGIDG